ncbi:MAG TPA: GtrA family protein [Rhizomicrobium sp.]|nr:GtrA family protein [Rhizomicrobium sp.]
MTQFVRRIQNSRFLRFALVGSAGFFVDEGVLWLMHSGLGLDPFTGRAISILSAMSFTWWGNRTITFSAHAAVGAGAILQEWSRFVAANAFGAVVNYGTFWSLLNFAPAPFNNAYLATAIGVGVGLIFNFTLSKRFVFRA